MNMLQLFLGALLLFADQSAPPDPSRNEAVEQKPADSKRTELNLLGTTDAAAGESRRNENLQFNLIDNNALKELNFRLGTNATIVTEFNPSANTLARSLATTP